MSVINQMLKDLDERQPESGVQTRVVSQPNKVNTVLVVLVAVMFTALVAAGVGFWWINNLTPAQSAVPQKTVSQSANTKAETHIAESDPQSVAVTSPQDTGVQSGKDVALADNQVQTQAPALEVPQGSAQEIVATVDSRSQNDEMAATAALPDLAEEPVTVGTEVTAISSEPLPLTPAPEQTSQPQAQQQLSIQRVTVSKQELASQAYEEGMQLLQNRDSTGAQSAFEKALDFDNEHREAQKQLAVLFYTTGLRREAISWLNTGLRQRPGDIEFRLMAARLLQKAEQKEQALSYLLASQPEVSSHMDYYALQAGLAQQTKAYQQAADTYLKLTQNFPQQSRFWLGLGVANEQLQRKEQAISAYQKSISTGRLSLQSKEFARKRMAILGG